MTNEGPELTKSFLKKKGFVRETVKIGTDLRYDDQGKLRVVDEVEIWWIKDGLSIHEDQWSEKNKFAFATYIKADGSFKAGNIISTETQLDNLYFALNSKHL